MSTYYVPVIILSASHEITYLFKLPYDMYYFRSTIFYLQFESKSLWKRFVFSHTGRNLTRIDMRLFVFLNYPLVRIFIHLAAVILIF